ncbi:putative transcriptional regulator [Enterococcus sp. PF1-24]|uniref:ArsR/SmtB family transcription factor n=1 Tax=unclassified Enterococcus TaxID=2608891 RepID=UPI0024765E00|nr:MULTISPECIES: winged helix-turn-helix domain-containing protein [unclassified Enterococcus]MDH6365694.1 putative transcriptional regulator [Enterococcus sp. PFB1-1]MDH6402806.1 putative transcriptional regulator [Enterococcus sp. PF1-24]
METNKQEYMSTCRTYVEKHIDFDFYKTLFDPVRMEILIYLLAYGPKNIKDISENFPQDRSVISRHLDLMHRFGMVEKNKENRNIYYDASRTAVMEKFEDTTSSIKSLMDNAPAK